MDVLEADHLPGQTVSEPSVERLLTTGEVSSIAAGAGTRIAGGELPFPSSAPALEARSVRETDEKKTHLDERGRDGCLSRTAAHRAEPEWATQYSGGARLLRARRIFFISSIQYTLGMECDIRFLEAVLQLYRGHSSVRAPDHTPNIDETAVRVKIRLPESAATWAAEEELTKSLGKVLISPVEDEISSFKNLAENYAMDIINRQFLNPDSANMLYADVKYHGPEAAFASAMARIARNDRNSLILNASIPSVLCEKFHRQPFIFPHQELFNDWLITRAASSERCLLDFCEFGAGSGKTMCILGTALAMTSYKYYNDLKHLFPPGYPPYKVYIVWKKKVREYVKELKILTQRFDYFNGKQSIELGKSRSFDISSGDPDTLNDETDFRFPDGEVLKMNDGTHAKGSRGLQSFNLKESVCVLGSDEVFNKEAMSKLHGHIEASLENKWNVMLLVDESHEVIDLMKEIFALLKSNKNAKTRVALFSATITSSERNSVCGALGLSTTATLSCRHILPNIPMAIRPAVRYECLPSEIAFEQDNVCEHLFGLVLSEIASKWSVSTVHTKILVCCGKMLSFGKTVTEVEWTEDTIREFVGRRSFFQDEYLVYTKDQHTSCARDFSFDGKPAPAKKLMFITRESVGIDIKGVSDIYIFGTPLDWRVDYYQLMMRGIRSCSRELVEGSTYRDICVHECGILPGLTTDAYEALLTKEAKNASPEDPIVRYGVMAANPEFREAWNKRREKGFVNLTKPKEIFTMRGHHAGWKRVGWAGTAAGPISSALSGAGILGGSLATTPGVAGAAIVGALPVAAYLLYKTYNSPEAAIHDTDHCTLLDYSKAAAIPSMRFTPPQDEKMLADARFTLNNVLWRQGTSASINGMQFSFGQSATVSLPPNLLTVALQHFVRKDDLYYRVMDGLHGDQEWLEKEENREELMNVLFNTREHDGSDTSGGKRHVYCTFRPDGATTGLLPIDWSNVVDVPEEKWYVRTRFSQVWIETVCRSITPGNDFRRLMDDAPTERTFELDTRTLDLVSLREIMITDEPSPAASSSSPASVFSFSCAKKLNLGRYDELTGKPTTGIPLEHLNSQREFDAVHEERGWLRINDNSYSHEDHPYDAYRWQDRWCKLEKVDSADAVELLQERELQRQKALKEAFEKEHQASEQRLLNLKRKR